MPQDPKSTVISALINNRSRCQVQTRSALISCACGGGWVRFMCYTPGRENKSNRPNPMEMRALISLWHREEKDIKLEATAPVDICLGSAAWENGLWTADVRRVWSYHEKAGERWQRSHLMPNRWFGTGKGQISQLCDVWSCIQHRHPIVQLIFPPYNA